MKWFVGLLVIMSGGCVSAPQPYVSAQFYSQIPRSVAVLPFENQSLDLMGPEMLRKMTVQRLGFWGYTIVPLEQSDAKLQGMGITDGGQLKSLSPQEIGKQLGVEGLCYGTVEQFSFQNVGFYLKRSVGVRLKLVSALSGERLWEGSGEARVVEVHGKKDKAERAFVRGLAQKAAENMFKSPLKPEANEALDRLFLKIPRRQ
ncbi:MAG: DUF799 family lipoprotein [Elusimicrobia bacterium]|nr:DUF799 family lipoprotein [Elusimicrobiota bacterium]